jgi:hypothetical protein
MPIKVQPVDTTQPSFKILVGKYRQLRASAYQSGVLNYPIKPQYTFEQDEWTRGREEDQRLRPEMARGER